MTQATSETPSPIDGSTTPGPGAPLAHVQDVDEVLVLHPRPPRVVRMNQSAWLIWNCLDGQTPLETIATELAEAFDAEPEAVLSDTVATVERFGREGFLAATPGPTPDDEPCYSPVITGACLDRVDQLGWADSFAVAVGGHHVGIRVDDAHAGAALRQALGDHVVADPDAPPNFSVQLRPESPRQRGVEPLKILYMGCTIVARTRSARALREALVRHLGRFSRDGTVHLMASAVVGPRGAMILPARYSSGLERRRRRLAAEGVHAVTGSITVDEDGSVVVPGTRLTVDADGAAAFDALAPGRSGAEEAADAPEGRYPVRLWGLFGANEFPEDGGPPDWAVLQRGLTQVADPDNPGNQQVLDTLHAMAHSTDSFHLPAERGVVDAAREMVR